jgi:ribosome modulation factor
LFAQSLHAHRYQVAGEIEMAERSKQQIWIVIDKRGQLVGAFVKHEDAVAATEAWPYMCDIEAADLQQPPARQNVAPSQGFQDGLAGRPMEVCLRGSKYAKDFRLGARAAEQA